MAKEIKTEILIQASPEKVWQVLTDFDHYLQWNPFIKSIEGNVAVGNTIKARIEPPGATGMTFKPVVLVYTEAKEFRWLGHLLIKGLFDGEHCFRLIDNEDGSTTFIQSEKFTGVLVPLFSKMLDTNTIEGFRQMNEKLKQEAEKDNVN
ncbi:MAG: SRPBCC domain-containing protein [Chitinophagales bacterium]|jgi:hypothetical protein|nr:SRPBCC domain-containing protein [Chitinophagales bacterium]